MKIILFKYHSTWMKFLKSKFKIIERKVKSFFNNPKKLLPFVKQSKLFFFGFENTSQHARCFHQLKGPFTIHMKTFMN